MLWGLEQCVIRNHLTGTQNRNSLFFLLLFLFSFLPLLICKERKRETDKGKATGRRGERRRWRSERGWGVSKKVWTPAPLWPVKITRWAFRVSEDEGGRGIRSFSARQGTAHAWLTLWIPVEPIYMLFLLPLYPILKVCQSQSLCLFQISLTSVCVRVSLCACASKGNLQAFFFFFSHALAVQHYTQTAQQRLSGKCCVSVECVLRCMQLQRSNYARFESTDTPMSKDRLYKSHTVISGKICLFFFSILLRAWQYNIKPWQIKAINYLLFRG